MKELQEYSLKIHKTFCKCVDVIESCETPTHVINARKYIKLFHELYPSQLRKYLQLRRLTDEKIYEFARRCIVDGEKMDWE